MRHDWQTCSALPRARQSEWKSTTESVSTKAGEVAVTVCVGGVDI